MTVSTLPDKLAEVQRRLVNLEVKADALRRKIAATGQPVVEGERFTASVRTVALRELDMDALRKRLSEAQLQSCFRAVPHCVVTVIDRDGDD